MNFTPSQQSAKDLRDCSLIVSAGAGSGKTAVLTQRILERICDENDDCNIDDFLIVTFTTAAAKELSDRIRRKLSQKARECPYNKKVINNIALLPLAKISTINAFCYEIVRENFQKLSLSASVRIADDAEMEVIRQKELSQVLEDYFGKIEQDNAFLDVYETFSSSKSDKGLMDTLLELDKKLRCLADREGFIKRVLCEYDKAVGEDEFFDTAFGKRLCENTKRQAQKAIDAYDKLIEQCAKYDDLAKSYLAAIEAERDFSRGVLCACEKGYMAVKEVVDTGAKTAMKPVRNAQNPYLKDFIKDTKNAVCDEFRKMLWGSFACDRQLLSLAAADTKRILEKIFEIIEVFSKRLEERKRQLGIIEFSDAERYTLQLLVDSFEPFRASPLAESLRRKYKEIYIDEYQDVNPLQDMIFKSISRHDEKGDEYTRFMVGDIKQSIYRFRGASSEIFMNYRDTFCDIDEVSSKKRIFMSDNFRCCESVIDFSNAIFQRLMSSYYTDGDNLVFSREEKNKLDNKAQLMCFSYDKDIAQGLSATELEAAYICKKIVEYVDNPRYTDSTGKMYTYSDIGVLARSKTALRTYEKVFSAFGLPVESDVGESFYGKKEIILCTNILNSIDNPQRDIYLAGFMRSFAGGFYDDELAIIKKDFKKCSLYNAVKSYSEGDSKNEHLKGKCREFIEKLSFYRSYSRGKSAQKLLWRLYCDLDLLNMCCEGEGEIDKRNIRKNLLKLYSIARDFSATCFRGVGAFLDYIAASKSAGEVKAQREPGQSAVKLMTIHASKGLEFPICFVCDISRRFNKSDESAKLIYSEHSGVATSFCDTAAMQSVTTKSGLVSISTPYKSIVKSGIDKELLDEEIRILYVAVTRARDMLVMTGSFHKKIDGVMKDAVIYGSMGDYTSASNFLSLILACLYDKSALLPFYKAAECEVMPKETDGQDFLECTYIEPCGMMDIFNSLCTYTQKKTVDITEDEIDEKLLSELLDMSSRGMPQSKIPAKLTVSRLKKGLLDEESIYEQNELLKEDEAVDLVPRFVLESTELSQAEKGTAMHMFMQFCDFDVCHGGECEAEADRLLSEGFITREQRDALDISTLSRFFSSQLYLQISRSKRIYREQRFNLEVQSFDEGIRGDILVQGVIDLFYENDDGTYTLVDFKTDRVYGEAAEKILIERHTQQLLYYKRAVEQMTGCQVKDTYIYSFSLSKEILI